MKVLVVPDKFKGTLTAAAAAQAIARGWRRLRPQDRITLLPMSDGGDGFGDVLGTLLGAKTQSVKTVDAAHRPCRARWWWEPKSKSAVIESANVIGLAMLPPGKFHPFELDTFGLGAVVRAAAKKGARRCLIGIGGSATNDGGFGLARALGWNFLKTDGQSIQQWTELPALAQIHPPKQRRWFGECIVAVDVQNPLLGPRGATRVYGPQKGLVAGEFAAAEHCLRRLAAVFKKDFGQDFGTAPGAGAAGGLGFGLLGFLGARPEPGFDLFARHAKLNKILRTSDLVLTGEGRLDASTLMGKGVGEMARRCRQLNLPCVCFAGDISQAAEIRHAFTQAHALTALTSPADAKARPAFWLERSAQACAGAWA